MCFLRRFAKEAEEEKKLAAITAAMPGGTGLKKFSQRYPDRFFDVGIAEEHAVSFAAGLALGGVVPVVAIYSSFLQRAVDQMLHDVCMQKLHVIFAVDRAGLVGADGETHQGNFDISYLGMMPGMTVMAPKNDWELREMLHFAVKAEGPVAMRYPRGNAYQGMKEHQAPHLPWQKRGFKKWKHRSRFWPLEAWWRSVRRSARISETQAVIRPL